jgi:hypothetical protein
MVFDVEIYHPTQSVTHEASTQRLQGLMSRATRPETVRAGKKILLVCRAACSQSFPGLQVFLRSMSVDEGASFEGISRPQANPFAEEVSLPQAADGGAGSHATGNLEATPEPLRSIEHSVLQTPRLNSTPLCAHARGPGSA